MARKERGVRRVDERNDNMRTGGGQIIQGGLVAIPAAAVIQPPAPENVTIGAEVLLRTTYTPKVAVNVTWTAPANLLPDLYLIEYAEDVNYTVNVLRQTTTLTRIALEMKTATEYWIRVKAQIRGIYSDWAYPNDDTVNSAITTMDDTTPPNPVVLDTATAITGDFELVWTNPTSDNFFETRVRIYDFNGGTLYKEVFVVGNPSSKSRYILTVAENEEITAGSFLTSVYYELLAYSLAGVPAVTAVTGTLTKAKPTIPAGLSNTWSGDNGTYDEGVTIAWNNQNYIKEYYVGIDGQQKRTPVARYVYNYTENVADHRPTLKSGDPNLSYTIQAVDRLNQLSGGSSGNAINIAPQNSNITLQAVPGFSSLYAYATITDEIKDINHYTWTLASGGGAIIRNVDTTTPEITFTTLKGIYDLQLRAVDHFGQTSNPITISGLILDGLTIGELRAETIYTSDDIQTNAAYAALNDGILTVGATSHALSATAWRWIQAERPLLDRYRTITFVPGSISGGTLAIYFSISSDGTNWSWYSGPLVSTGAIAGSTTLTVRASEALAQSNALTMVAGTIYRFDFPSIIEARYIRVHHRNTTSSYNFREFYPRRLLQSDDIEAESIKGINIAAASIVADHISVTQLSAITANIGQLVIDTTGYIWQGTGTAASPTTGLKIDNSGGIGRLRTFNATVVQISLDTDGKLKAGAGTVVLDANGVEITGASFTYHLTNLSPVVVPAVNSLKWTETTANTAAQVTGSLDGQLLLRGDRITLAYPIPTTDDNYGIDIIGSTGGISIRGDSIGLGIDGFGSAVQIDGSVVSGSSVVHLDGSLEVDNDITALGSITGDEIVAPTGTWTPVLKGTGTAGTFTYTVQTGRYIKFNKWIIATGRIDISAISVAPTGNMRIGGLPFTVLNSVAIGTVDIGLLSAYNLGATTAFLTGMPANNTTDIAFFETIDNAGAGNALASGILTNFIIAFTAIYVAA